MTTQVLILVALYGGMSLLNAVISLWFWRRSRLSIYASLATLWVGYCIAYVLSGLTQDNLLHFALIGILPGTFLSGVGICQVLLRFIGQRPNYKILLAMPCTAIVTTLLLYSAGLPFEVYAIPVGLQISGPLAYGLIRLWREKNERLTPAKNGFALTALITVFHALDFSILGARPDTILVGTSIGMLIALGFAIFGPLVVLEVANADAIQLKIERGEIEKELKEAGVMLELIADTASLLSLSLDYKGVVEQTVRLGITHFGGICALHLLDDGPESLRLAAVAHGPGANGGGKHSDALREFESRLQSYSLLPEAIRAVILDGNPARSKAVPAQSGFLSSFLSVPMQDRGRVCGVLSLFSMTRTYTDRDLRLASELAVRASSAIQSARLFQEAQQAVRLRDEFLAVASHELKTPLTSLNLQIETLRNLAERNELHALQQDQLKRMLGMSGDQLKNLARLIDGLLDVSRVTAHGIVLGSKERVDLAQLMADVTARLEGQLRASHCSLELESEPDVVGHWDRIRIDQIATNLLTNAIKYGAGKPIRIQVKRVADHAILVVQDSGIGVLAEDRERIFGRFERAVPVQRFGGLGLGLYIAREIARAHGGSIRVESEPGVVTRFIVELPLERPA